MELHPRLEVIRWSASDTEVCPDVIETQLALPTPIYLALEEAARARHMTVGQMARVFLARAIQTPDLPPPADSTEGEERPARS